MNSTADEGANETRSQLRKVPLFAALDDAAADALTKLLRPSSLPAGTKLFRVGDPGDSMFIIDRGRVRISVCDADGHEVILAELRRGDFFGEMAVIDGQGRSADATVMEDARLELLSRENFLSFVSSDVRIPLEMLSAIARRLRRTDQLLLHRVSRNLNSEEKARMTLADRAADLIAEFGGSWKFIIANIIFFIFWVILNTMLIRRDPFDPYPFVLLNLVLGMITGLQAPIIMMSQNRQAEKDRLRADLDYQVNLKNEMVLGEILRRVEQRDAKDKL